MSNKKSKQGKIDRLILSIKRAVYIHKIMRLKRKADNIREKTGIQQFIIKYEGIPTIIGRDQFKWMRQVGIVKKNQTIDQVRAIALYSTAK